MEGSGRQSDHKRRLFADLLIGCWRAKGPKTLILLRAAGPPACARARARSRREGGAPPRVRARASSVSSGVATAQETQNFRHLNETFYGGSSRPLSFPLTRTYSQCFICG